jgi:hypothetical protein
MNDLSPVPASNPADAHRVLRLVALGAVILGLLVLAAAAIASSYGGIHALALTAGVSPALARIYPLAFDAMGVVASAAVLSLRGAGVIMRCYAWLAMLVLLCAAAGADALHATGARLPHRAAEATVAIVPWAFVLIGFGLLLAMLRHARLRRALATQARAIAAQANGAQANGAQENGAQENAAQENGTHAAAHSPAHWVPRAREEDPLGSEDRYVRDYPAPVMSPAPTAHANPGRHAGPETAAGAQHTAGPERDGEGEGEGEPIPVAHFDRMWSSPTPPDA